MNLLDSFGYAGGPVSGLSGSAVGDQIGATNYGIFVTNLGDAIVPDPVAAEMGASWLGSYYPEDNWVSGMDFPLGPHHEFYQCEKPDDSELHVDKRFEALDQFIRG